MKNILVINASQSKIGTARGMADFVIEYITKKYGAVTTDFSDKVDGTWGYDDILNDEISPKYSILQFDLKKLTYKGCIDCGFCKKHRRCMLKDDIKYMYRYFDEADYIILASPVYFGGAPSKLKALIDRMQAVFHSKYTHKNSLIDQNKKRYALNILAGGEKYRENLFSAFKTELEYFYMAVNTDIKSYLEFGDTDNVNPNLLPLTQKKLAEEIENLLNTND